MKRLAAATRSCGAAGRRWSRSGRVLALIAIGLVLAVAGPSVLAPAAYASGCAAPSGAYATEVLSDSPVAYFPLDESSGPTICDDSGNSDNGTYATSGVTYGVPGPIAGASSTAVQGDGSNPSLLGSAPAITGLNGNQSFSVEGWFKATSTTNETVVALSGGNTVAMAVWSSHTTCGEGSNNNNSALALDEHGTSNCWDTTADGVNLFDGNWHYLAITYDATTDTMAGYVDGMGLGSEPAALGGFVWSSPTVLLGGWIDNSVNQPFIGDAAQVAVYPTALDPAEVSGHYEGGLGRLTGPAISNYKETSVTTTSETITADVNDRGEAASYAIRYGTSTAYGTQQTPSTWSAGATSVTFNLTGLTDNTTYDFEVIGTNILGQSTGGNATFSTPAPPPPLPPPTITDVSSTLTGLQSATFSATLNAAAEPGLTVTTYVEYATHSAYTQATKDAAPGANPYNEKTAAMSSTATHGFHNIPFVYNSGYGAAQFSPGTTYDYRVVASSNLTPTVSYSADYTFTTPPAGPTVTSYAASSVSQTGATLSGEINPKALSGTYTFNWTAQTPSVGCTSANPVTTGSVSGSLSGANGEPVYVDTQLNQILPAGTVITYSLSFDTKLAGFRTAVTSSPQSYTTGIVPTDGTPYTDLQGGHSATLYAYMPQFAEPLVANSNLQGTQLGTSAAGGIVFVGALGEEYGVLATSTATSPSWSYGGNAQLSGSCGTLLSQQMSGLTANTDYKVSSSDTVGVGDCPGPVPPGEYSNNTQYYSDVDLTNTTYACWVDGLDALEGYENGDGDYGYGTGADGWWVLPPVSPDWTGPYLGSIYGSGEPAVVKQNSFQTPATSAPADPSVSGTTGTGDDGLGCSATSTCDGSQTIKYAATAPPSGSAASAHARRITTLVLGKTHFKIRPHRHEQIRLKLTPAGKRFLLLHKNVLSVELVTTVRAGKRKAVTYSTPMKVRSALPVVRRVKPKRH